MMPTSIAAVLWDMDGTLIDSEPAWIRAQTEIVASFGGAWSRNDGLALVGSTMEQTVEALQAKGVRMNGADLLATLEAKVLRALQSNISWRAGALQLAQSVNTAGVPQAIVTTSPRVLVEPVLEALQEYGVNTAITGDDVVHGKPDPEPYLRAAQILEVDITRCIAIEDSPTGIRSAVASGATTLGVPHDVPLTELQDVAFWPSLEGRSLDDLQRLRVLP